jgi:hypothetical protein
LSVSQQTQSPSVLLPSCSSRKEFFSRFLSFFWEIFFPLVSSSRWSDLCRPTVVRIG